MKKIISMLLLALFYLCFICLPVNIIDKIVYASNEINSSAIGMAVIEGNTNTLLYSKNSDMKLPMASTTKIVTCIVAIENCDNIDKKIIVSDRAVGIEGTSIYLKKNEVLSIRELLLGLMLASGNDCAVALAEELGGYDNFVEKMNSFAVRCGANNTHFTNPHGLDENDHYTTAYDLALMTSYALKNNIFRDISSTKNYIIPPTNVYEYQRFLKHKNKNIFLDDKCIGVKTGFTDNAKRCLVNASEKDGMQIISVVLNCQPMFEECRRLDDLAYDEYQYNEFVKPYSYVGNCYVKNGDKEEIGIVTLKGFGLVIRKDEINKYEVIYDIPAQVTAPIELSEEVGSVKVIYDDEIIFESPLFAIDSTDNIDLKFKLDSIIEKWFF